jgi:uncharacterized protein YbjT (DUF2867 family)
MILVAGGTGRLGTIVVHRLAANGHNVRVFARDPARARHLPQDTVEPEHTVEPRNTIEVVRGDVRDRGSIEPAMVGVTTVVSAVQGFAGRGRVTPDSVDRAGNMHLIDAAEAVGADVVLMSVVGAAPDSPMDLFRAKYAAEQHLRAARVPWTVVRATAFVELWAEILGKAPVFGRGDNPINFVSVHDVAAVVVRAVQQKQLRGEIVEVGGPDNVTFNELVALVREARGSDRTVRHVPRWLLRALAPVARQPRAALAMDTLDMTFTAAANRSLIADLPMTGLHAAVCEDGTRFRAAS